jgi:hypothetical protein
LSKGVVETVKDLAYQHQHIGQVKAAPRVRTAGYGGKRREEKREVGGWGGGG